MDVWSCACVAVLVALCMHCFNMKGTQAVYISHCPEQCVCDQRTAAVTCTGIKHISWLSFISSVPQDTRSLVIQDSAFSPEPTTSPSSFMLPLMETLKILSSNFLHMHFSSFKPVKNIRELHLDDNSIVDIDSSLFVLLDKLEVFSVKGNHIMSLSTGTFQYASNLRILSLAGNQLKHLAPKVFHPLTMLQVLDISSNQIQFIHPDSFKNNSHLEIIKLESNNLQTIHSETFPNHTVQIHVHDNPLDCNCGLKWLTDSLVNEDENARFKNKYDIRCYSPKKLHSIPVYNVTKELMLCTDPKIDYAPEDINVQVYRDVTLHCNATGYPNPSIYWITPRGVIADPNHWKWLTSDTVHFHKSQSFIAGPSYHQSKVVAHEDGSLTITDFRLYFAGEYVCVAENPGGSVMAAFNVSITSPIQSYVHFSMLIGAATALGWFILFAFAAAIKICFIITSAIMSERYDYDQKSDSNQLDIENPYDIETDHESVSPYFYKRYSPAFGFTPFESPTKCATPAEDSDAEKRFAEMGGDIMERLTDVRERLRNGMERHVGRMRTRAQNVRYSSTRYVQNIKDNSSRRIQNIRDESNRRIQAVRDSSHQYIHTIRSSGSEYANRVRAGVTLGVEQVKYHVQSMKELCGTGDMTHTISVVSFSTNVDSQQTNEIVKTVTHTYV